jgi:hypothetical protein
MALSVRAWLSVAAASSAIAAAAGVAAQRVAPPPIAAAALGTDDVFGDGLHERELPNPLRWTTERAAFRFRNLPSGTAALTVDLYAQRDWVAVAGNGKLLGTIAPGTTRHVYTPIVPSDGRLDVELRVRPFTAGDGRRLGAQIGRVSVDTMAARTVRLGPLAAFVCPAVLVASAMLVSGWGPLVALAAGLVVTAAQWALLFPWGILWSAYPRTLALLLGAGAVACAALARVAEKRWPGARRWAMLAGLAVLLVQGAAATWPSMMASDFMMNAHNLEKVSAGDWRIVSRTQHAPPFLFPYGPAFYAPLIPFERAGSDPLRTVRAGAAVAGVVGSIGLFWLLAPGSAPAAAAAVVMLQLLPGTFDRYSYGNLSNIFAQSMTIWFFAWWARGGAGGPVLGAAALLLAALGHFSSFLVLCILLPALLIVRRGWGDLPRVARLAALGAGLLVLAYYATFVPLILKQLPRLLEGAGAQAQVRSTADVLRKQGWEIFWEWGLPAIAIAWAGRPRARTGLDGDLLAFWAAGGVLALAALVSPVEARYLYALTLPLSVAAGHGATTLARGPAAGRWTLAALACAQLGLALYNLRDDLYFHYRG